MVKAANKKARIDSAGFPGSVLYTGHKLFKGTLPLGYSPFPFLSFGIFLSRLFNMLSISSCVV